MFQEQEGVYICIIVALFVLWPCETFYETACQKSYLRLVHVDHDTQKQDIHGQLGLFSTEKISKPGACCDLTVENY